MTGKSKLPSLSSTLCLYSWLSIFKIENTIYIVGVEFQGKYKKMHQRVLTCQIWWNSVENFKSRSILQHTQTDNMRLFLPRGNSKGKEKRTENVARAKTIHFDFKIVNNF